jgi:hypothetical protein
MAASETQTELIPVDLSVGVIAQVEVVKTGREKVRVGTLLFDLGRKAIAKVSQVVATPIQAAKLAKAMMKSVVAAEMMRCCCFTLPTEKSAGLSRWHDG